MPTTHAPGTRDKKDRYKFLREFLANPGKIGAVAPSSRRLSRLIVETLDLTQVKTVVEAGPGTGVVTAELLPRLKRGTKFLAIELSENLSELWRHRFPRERLYTDSVEHIARICAKEGIEKGTLDAVVSGLPFASFPEKLQRSILGELIKMIRPGGQFVTFGYQIGRWLPAGRRFHKMLPEYFRTIDRSEHVWRNLPPAFVIHGVK